MTGILREWYCPIRTIFLNMYIRARIAEYRGQLKISRTIEDTHKTAQQQHQQKQQNESTMICMEMLILTKLM